MDTNIKVGIRVRPVIAREVAAQQRVLWKTENDRIFNQNPNHNYQFDHVFGQSTTTAEVYQVLGKPLVDKAMEGFNGTLFAYGQTASGKTHTIMGDNDEPGIVPMAIQDVFNIINDSPDREFLLRASYVEIYNEEITDLIANKKGLKIRNNVDNEIVIDQLTECTITSCQDAMELILKGIGNRKIGTTNMNERSSRSHTIFRLVIESRQLADELNVSECDGAVIVAQLNLVDLAGSERVAQTGAQGLRLKESGFINTSLMTLGLVIRKLSENDGHVPYRDSKLTRILQHSLGGNARTSIICAVSPVVLDETDQTLKFACRAKTVTNKPKINEEKGTSQDVDVKYQVVDGDTMLKRQTREIRELKRKIKELEDGSSSTNWQDSLLIEKDKMQLSLQQKLDEQQGKISKLLKQIICSGRSKSANAAKARRQTWAPGALLKAGVFSKGSQDDNIQVSRGSRQTDHIKYPMTVSEEFEDESFANALSDDSTAVFEKVEFALLKQEYEEFKAQTCTPEKYKTIQEKLSQSDTESKNLRQKLEQVQNENQRLRSMNLDEDALEWQKAMEVTLQQNVDENARLKQQQAAYEEEKEAYEEKVMDLQTKLSTAKNEVNELKFKVDTIRNEKDDEMRVQKLEFEKLQRDVTEREMEAEIFKNKIRDMESRCNELLSNSSNNSGFLQMQEAMEETIQKKIDEIAQLKGEKDEISLQNSSLEEYNESLKETVESITKELNEAKQNIGRLEDQQEKMYSEEFIEHLKSEVLAKSLELQEKIDASQAENETLRQNLEQSKAEYESELDQLRIEKLDLQEKLDERDHRVQEMENVKNLITDTEMSMDNVKERLDKLEVAKEKLENASRRWFQCDDLDNLEENIAKLFGENDSLSENSKNLQEQLNAMNTDHEALKTNHIKTQLELADVSSKHEQQIVAVKELNEQLNNLQNELVEKNILMQSSPTDDDIKMLEQKIQEHKQEVIELNHLTSTIKTDYEKMEEERNKLTNELLMNTETLTAKDKEIEELSQQVNTMQNQIDELNLTVSRQLPMEAVEESISSDLVDVSRLQEVEHMLREKEEQLILVLQEREEMVQKLQQAPDASNMDTAEETNVLLDELKGENKMLNERLEGLLAEKEEQEMKVNEGNSNALLIEREQEIVGLKGKLDSLIADHDKLSAETTVTTEELVKTKSNAERNEIMLKELSEEYQKQTQQSEALQDQLANKTKQLEDLERQLEEKLTQSTSTAEINVDGDNKQSVELSNELQQLTHEREQLLTESNTLKEQLENIQAENEKLSSKLEDYIMKNSELEEMVESLNSEKVVLMEDLDNFKQQLDDHDKSFNDRMVTVKDEVDTLRNSASTNLQTMNQEMETIQERNQTLSAQVQSLQNQLEELKDIPSNVQETGNNDDVKTFATENEELKLKVEELNEKLVDEINQKNGLESDIATLKDVIESQTDESEVLQTAFEKKCQEFIELSQKESALKSELTQSQESYAKVMEDYNSMKLQLNELCAEKEKLDMENSGLSQKLAGFENHVKSLEEQKQNLLDGSNASKQLLADLQSKESVLTEKELELTYTQEKYKELQMIIASKDEEIEQLQNEVKEFESLCQQQTAKINELQMNSITLQSEKEDLLNDFEILSGEKQEWDDKLEDVKKQCESHDKEIEQLKQEHQLEIDTQKDMLKSFEEELNQERQLHLSSKEEKTKMEEKVDTLLKEKETLSITLTELTEERSSLVSKVNCHIEEQTQMQKLLDEAQQKMISDKELLQNAFERRSDQSEAYAQELSATVRKLQNHNERITEEKEALEGEVKSLMNDISENDQISLKLQQEHDEVVMKLNEKISGMGHKFEQLSQLEDEIKKLNEQVENLENVNKEQYVELKNANGLIIVSNEKYAKLELVMQEKESEFKQQTSLLQNNADKALIDEKADLEKQVKELKSKQDTGVLEMNKLRAELLAFQTIQSSSTPDASQPSDVKSLQEYIKRLEYRLKLRVEDISVYADRVREQDDEIMKIKKQKQKYSEHIHELREQIKSIQRPSGNPETKDWEELIAKVENENFDLQKKNERLEYKNSMLKKNNSIMAENIRTVGATIKDTEVRVKEAVKDKEEEITTLKTTMESKDKEITRVSNGLRKAFEKLKDSEQSKKELEIHFETQSKTSKAEIEKLGKGMRDAFAKYQEYKGRYEKVKKSGEQLNAAYMKEKQKCSILQGKLAEVENHVKSSMVHHHPPVERQQQKSFEIHKDETTRIQHTVKSSMVHHHQPVERQQQKSFEIHKDETTKIQHTVKSSVVPLQEEMKQQKSFEILKDKSELQQIDSLLQADSDISTTALKQQEKVTLQEKPVEPSNNNELYDSTCPSEKEQRKRKSESPYGPNRRCKLQLESKPTIDSGENECNQQ